MHPAPASHPFLLQPGINTPDRLISQSAVAQMTQFTEQIYQQMGFTAGAAGLYPQRGDHASSTCRMANGPDQGVVSQDLFPFGVNNLMIASNAVLPTLGAANPTLTLVALMIRAFFRFTGMPSRVLKGRTITRPQRP